MKQTALLGLESAALAIAVWLIPASVHVTSWPSSGPVRIAYLAPLSRLYVAVAVSALAGAALTMVWRRAGWSLDGLIRILAPVLLLWLWLVPDLSWLPDHVPLLLVLAGRPRWAVAGLALLGIAVEGGKSRLPDVVQALTADRRTVFIVSLAVYVVFGLRSARDVGFSGDEPHYLIITESLLKDHDLDIANNHERRDYRTFFPGELRPDFLLRGLHGEIYSIHAPGLPVLLAPSYAAFGARGAVVFLALLAALTALAIFDLAATLAGTRVAAVTWAATCFSVPFVPHAWLIYPELPAALVVAWAARWLHDPPAAPRTQLWHGAALALLPWLHTKFVVFVAVFAAFELMRSWRKPAAIAALLTPIGISTAAWLLSFYWMYGEFSPEAPYGTYTNMFVLAANVPRGALGLLFDQKFGLLAFSPVYVLVVAGWWTMWRRRPQDRVYAVELALTAGAFFVSTTRLYMWWGGSSAPARFLVPIVPLFAPLIAVAISETRGLIGRSIVGAALALTFALVAIPLGIPSLLYSQPHGMSSLVKAIQGSAPLDVALPTFTEENWRAPAATLMPWLLSAALAMAVVWGCVRGGWLRSIFWTATAACLATGVIGAVLNGFRSVPNRQALVLRGQLALLREFDPPHLRAVDVTRVKRLGDLDVLQAAALTMRRAPEQEIRNPKVLEGPFELPEGRYIARVWFSGAPPSGETFVGLSDAVVLARAAASAANPVALTFDLPVRTPAFVGVSDANVARAVNQIEIAPSEILPRSARDRDASHVVEPVGGEARGFIAYLDDRTYPENGVFWTRATDEGSVIVVTGGASTLRLVLHVGPTGGRVTVTVAGHATDVDFQPDETRELSFPVSDSRRVAVSVKAARAFRPADVDPRSDDHRLLGCQVRPLLS